MQVTISAIDGFGVTMMNLGLKRFGWLKACCAAFALCAGMALSIDAQGADGEKKPDEKKPVGEAKADDGAKKKADAEKKPAEKEYKEDFKDFESLMKAMRRQELLSNRSIRDKDAAKIKEQADKQRYYAAQMQAQDKHKRKDEADYKKWAEEMEKEARTLRDLAGAKEPDWAKITTQRDVVKKVCETCHAKYEEKKDK